MADAAKIVVYPEAQHGFDVAELPPKMQYLRGPSATIPKLPLPRGKSSSDSGSLLSERRDWLLDAEALSHTKQGRN